MTEAAASLTVIEPQSSNVAAPVPTATVTTFDPMAIMTMAAERNLSAEMLDRMISLGERMQAMAAKKAFDAAMAAACAEMPVIAKNRVVDFTSSKGRTHYRHEDLGEIARVAKPILAKHGLSYGFRTEVKDRVVTVTCIIRHRDGHSFENTLLAAVDDSGNKNHIQAIGSASTYLQRMTLKAALGLAAAEDDDGQAAGKAPTERDEPTLSEVQIAAITKAVEFKGRTVEALCERLKVASLADVWASKFDDVLAFISKLSDADAGR